MGRIVQLEGLFVPFGTKSERGVLRLLDVFIDRIERLDRKCINGFRDIMSTLEIPSQWIESRIPDPLPEGRYDRQLLHQGHDYEVVLAVWPKGIQTLVHDHGSQASQGMVKVLAGSIFNQTYLPDGDQVRPDSRQVFKSGDLIGVPVGLVHAMGHTGAGEYAASLHFYTPMIIDVTYWDPKTCRPLMQPSL